MGALKVEIPERMEEEMEESRENWSKIALEAIRLRLFEMRLSKSAALQKAMFEAVVSKSKLTEKGAKELADKTDEGMLRDIKKKFPGLL